MVGQNEKFTATVTSSQGGPGLTGTVQFTVFGTTVLGTVALSNGQAQLTTSSVPAGTPQIIATYSGDSNYVSSSAAVVLTVNQYPTATTVTTSNASVAQGSNVTFTANVAPTQSGGPGLTGSVQFYYSLSAVGGQNFIGGPLVLTNGQAEISINSLPVGSLFVGAFYLGDNNYSQSSGAVGETVTPTPTFLLTTNPPTITVASPGLSGSTMLTFTGQNGLTGSATLTSAMCSHLPSESTCSFSPSTINLTAQTATQTVTLTVMTMAPSSVTPSARRFIPGAWRGTARVALVCGLCFGLLLFGFRARQRRWNLVLASLAFAALATFASCGGGGSTGPPPPPPNLGTPVGNYTGVTVTVTINGVTQSINTIAVNVE